MQRPVGLARKQFARHFRGQNLAFLVDFGLLLLWLARAPENAVKALWLLGFVGLLISRMKSLPCERRSLDDEQRSLVSHCFIGSAHIAHFAHLKTEGGGGPLCCFSGFQGQDRAGFYLADSGSQTTSTSIKQGSQSFRQLPPAVVVWGYIWGYILH